jgi:hypothetical protein
MRMLDAASGRLLRPTRLRVSGYTSAPLVDARTERVFVVGKRLSSSVKEPRQAP